MIGLPALCLLLAPMPEIVRHLCVALALAGIYPLVDGLGADHVLALETKTAMYLLGAILLLGDKAAHLRLHGIVKSHGMRPLLHSFLVLALGKVMFVLMMAAAIAVPLYLA